MCDPLHCGAVAYMSCHCFKELVRIPGLLVLVPSICSLSDLFETCACRRGIGVQDYCSGWRMLTFQVIVQYTKQ
jgi:hypothetical protein